ncbi:hypothetical protein IHI26_00725 [Candidatus Parvarchaeota archaeon]|nr:hypothetical protein [Candidatus Acidifodinimicrobium mancum]MBE5729848.1 hypothetical protein [Candidatus Acidifodinimicrobium mancum]
MDKHGQFLSAVLVMMLALIMIAMFSVYAMILEGNGNVYTSLTSSSISSYMAEQIANQYSNIMPFSSSVNSTFSGMLKNFIAGYYPSYVLADSLLNYTNLTYDYVMPPNVTVPNSVEAYVGVILNNTQSSPTPAPFQQMINVPNTASFWNYINTTSGYFGQNVEFFYGNGKIIPSWLESYNSSSGKWWIKIGTISASSVTKIYMGFASKTTNLFNTNNVGEAPQLPSTYAEYDDGANVFNNYWNFAGTSLPSGWSGSGYTINNGLSIPYSSYAITTTDYGLNAAQVLDFYGDFPLATSADNAGFGYTLSSSAVTSSTAIQTWFEINNGVWSDDYAGGLVDNGASYAATAALATGSNVYTVYWPSSSSASFSVNYGAVTTLTSDIYTSQLPIGGANTQGSQATAGPIYWGRIRAYPPSGVMPSVTFGSVA